MTKANTVEEHHILKNSLEDIPNTSFRSVPCPMPGMA